TSSAASRFCPRRAIATSWPRAVFWRRTSTPCSASSSAFAATPAWPAPAPVSICGGRLCCTAFRPRPAASCRGFWKKRRPCRGFAQWAMPERSRGIHGCFLESYRARIAAQCGRWARSLPDLAADDRAADRDALGSIEHSLAELGVAADEWRDYLGAELLALRG